MRRTALVLCGLLAWASPTVGQEIKVDLGIGYVDGNLHSTSGGTGFNPKGIVGTVGWLAPSGLLIRLDVSGTQDQSPAVVDFGPGLEPAVDEANFRRLGVSVGYLFNAHGLVRPFLHGGVARLAVHDKFTGDITGISEVVIDSDDTVLTAGAGIEIGQDHHNLLFDVTLDPQYRVPSKLGPNAEFDFTEAHFAYLYRF